MKTLIHIKKNWVKCGVSLVIILGFLTASYYPSPETPRASAAASGSIVFDPSNFSKNLITAAYSVYEFVSTEAIRIKEYLLDGFAFAMINMILQQMSQSIITWINSGFQGSPAFLQDMDGFLKGIADKVVGDYIWGSNLNFLCSPFSLDLRLALEIQYKQTRNFATENKCTLSGVVGNMENFLNGNFLSGGWNGWFQMTQRPVNNPYGSMLMVSEQFSVRLGNTKGQELKLLDYGKGFLSVKQCKTVDDESGGHDECGMVTPGTAIEMQLNNTLDSGRQRIQVADEINEIIAALFSQLASQAFSGVGGLLGLTQSGNGSGSGTYYNSLYTQSPGATITTAQNPIQTSLTAEVAYKNALQIIVDDLQDASAYKVDTYGETDPCHDGLLTPELQTNLTTALDNISTSNTTLATLNTLLTQYNIAVAQKDTATQQSIMQQYLNLQAQGVLHIEADVAVLEEFYIPQNQELITNFESSIDTACTTSGTGQ